MDVFVALLRGVNVGGRRSLSMAGLRTSLEAFGWGRIRTYLQSGNLVFAAPEADPAAHARAIEERIHAVFELTVDVLVVRGAELSDIAASVPFGTDPAVDESYLHVTFLLAPVSSEAFAAVELPAGEGERVSLSGRVVYLYLPHGYGRTKLNNAFFERAFRTRATTRNWKTVRALAALAGSGVDDS